MSVSTCPAVLALAVLGVLSAVVGLVLVKPLLGAWFQNLPVGLQGGFLLVTGFLLIEVVLFGVGLLALWRRGRHRGPPRGHGRWFEATYRLSAEEASLFQRAWGPCFSWNPYSWWKGAAGQYYLAPEGVTVGQRIDELGRAAVITGAGIGGGVGISELTGE